MDLQDRLLRQAADTLDMEITQEQIKEAVEAQMQTLEAQLSQQGLTLDMYCQFLSTTPEKLRRRLSPVPFRASAGRRPSADCGGGEHSGRAGGDCQSLRPYLPAEPHHHGAAEGSLRCPSWRRR